MAAFLQIAPPRGATTAAHTIARLHRTVQATLDRQAGARPTLVCRWLQDADGRLSCHWEIEPPDIPIPPDLTASRHGWSVLSSLSSQSRAAPQGDAGEQG